MDLIPDDMPFLAQVTLGASYGALAGLLGGAVLYWLGRLLVLAPPTFLERLYALAVRRAPTQVVLGNGDVLTVRSGGRHSPHVVAARRHIETSCPTIQMQAIE